MENYLKIQLSEQRLPVIKEAINSLLKLEGFDDVYLATLSFGKDALDMRFSKNSGELITSSEQAAINSKIYNMGIIYMLRD